MNFDEILSILNIERTLVPDRSYDDFENGYRDGVERCILLVEALKTQYGDN